MPEKDHWKSLADGIGAEIPAERYEEAAPAPKSEAEPQPEPPALRPPKPKGKPAPPPGKSHWNSLADQLGLDLPPTEEPPEQPVLPDEPVEAQLPDFEAPMVPPAVPFATEPESEDFDSAGLRRDEEDNDPLVLRQEPFVEEVADAIDIDSVVDEADEADEREELQDTEGTVEPRRRRRRGRGRRHRDADRSTSESETSETSETSEVEQEPSAEESSESDDEPRRRRRRRKRAPRGSEVEQDQEAAEQADDDDDDDSEEDEAAHPRSKHKKIPSWGEAIGVIVAANLAARESSSSGRGRRRD